MTAKAINHNKLTHAMNAWRQLLGEEQVVHNESDLELYRKTSLPAAYHKISGCLKIKNRNQICEVIKIARHHKIGLYPFSTGKNWGYGDKLPSSGQQILVDLSGMNQILEINQELKYVVVEPGVTQVQLAQYLKDHHFPFITDVTGSSPHTSLIGNILEGGFGHTAYGHREKHILGLEAVLGTGEIYRSGYGERHIRDPYVFPEAIGPRCQHLFVQSNFGIVTKMAIALQPKPEKMCLMIATFDPKTLNNQQNPVKALATLKHQGVLKSIVKLSNNANVKLANTNSWIVIGAVYGLPGCLSALKRRVKNVLVSCNAKVNFMSPVENSFLCRVNPLLQKVGLHGVSKKISHLNALFSLALGQPTSYYVQSLYRLFGYEEQLSIGASETIETLAKGVIWCNAVIPARGQDLISFEALVKEVLQKYHLPCSINFNLMSAQAVVAIIGIVFSKEKESSWQNAQAAFEALQQTLNKEGYPAYRENSQSMDFHFQQAPEYTERLKKIKSVFDPDGVIAPGRYVP